MLEQSIPKMRNKKPEKTNAESVCLKCGKRFSYRKRYAFHFRKFCSVECQKANRGHNLGAWN